MISTTRRLIAALSGPGWSGQIMRYGVTGVAVTALQVAVYWILAELAQISALVANVAGYFCALASGYVLHSRWSFRGHGRRDAPLLRTSRFVVVSLFGLALNSMWVVLLVEWLGGQTWWPIPLMVVVTPLLVFKLNRHWVFQ
ncbi:MAG TPA: GtrA family protein [Candidatus Acidoferrum sp.]|nr:GtrA family protein [Candidatus Acidoferrum sp.]